MSISGWPITVTNANDDPTDITLSAATLPENSPYPTNIGDFTTTDADTADSHTYSFVAGTGDDDNADFEISGSTLRTKNNVTYDFETKSAYTVRIQTNDGNGGTYFCREN